MASYRLVDAIQVRQQVLVYILIRALIKSSEFVAKHLQNLITDKSSASLVLSPSCPSDPHGPDICSGHRRSLLISFSDDCDDDRAHAVTELLNVPLVGSGICGWLYWEDVFGHCDGILRFVRDHCRKIMLCNPALQESKVLPKTKNCDNNYCVGLGFGYDSVTNDYKLVRIFQKPTVIVEVYSLSKDSWRQIEILDHVAREIDITSLFKYLYWKGFCYWGLMEDYKFDLTILCFNFSSETFHVIPIPHCVWNWTSFVMWNDSFTFLKCYEEGENSNSKMMEMWVMDVYDIRKGSNGGWTLSEHLLIGPLVGVKFPLTFWNSNQFLMQDEDDKLLSLNFRTLKLRK